MHLYPRKEAAKVPSLQKNTATSSSTPILTFQEEMGIPRIEEVQETVCIGQPMQWKNPSLVMAAILAAVAMSVAASLLGWGKVFPVLPGRADAATPMPVSTITLMPSDEETETTVTIVPDGTENGARTVTFTVPNKRLVTASTNPSATPSQRVSDAASIDETPANSPTRPGATPSPSTTAEQPIETPDTPESTPSSVASSPAQTTEPVAPASPSSESSSAEATAESEAPAAS